MATMRASLVEAVGQLAEAGVSDAEREAAWLLAHVIGCSVGALRVREEANLPGDQAAAFDNLVKRRASREPLQYILGTEEFLGLTFRVTPAVLIPRLDTETLVRESAALVHGSVRIADIGTGSGAIAVGMATLLPEATIVAVDISPQALEIARENARANGVAERVEFRRGDLLAPLLGERFDVILSNPPYIGEDELPGLMPEVRDWEPRIALTPGPDGALIFRRLLHGSPALLKPGGFLGVEVGQGQAPIVGQLFEQAGFTVTIHRDSAGIERAVIGRLHKGK